MQYISCKAKLSFCRKTIDIGQAKSNEVRGHIDYSVKIPRTNEPRRDQSLLKHITQGLLYRQSLMWYVEKYGVSCASQKYNKSRSYNCFWKARWDRSAESLARRPHHHPMQHMEAELKLVLDMRHRNPGLGLIELWNRLRQRGVYPAESLYRVMWKLWMLPTTDYPRAHSTRLFRDTCWTATQMTARR